MRNIQWQKNVAFVISAALLVLVTWVAVLTHTNRNMTNANPFIVFIIQNHLSFMFAAIITSAAVGFIWSGMLYGEIRKKKEASMSTLETVLLFLNQEEKDIINYLVGKEGTATQAEIARLPKMNRVKAYRSLQKMKDKRLIEITPHGKMRRLMLKDNILSTLVEGSSGPKTAP